LWGEQEGDDVDELNVALTDHNPHTLLRPSPAELARGRALFERHSASGVAHTGAELVSTAHVNAIEELPGPDPLHVPEVAFAGRSNVGKSSLLGRLMRADSHFVKASSTPGKTQSVNFYAFQPKMQFGMVDLPGYGFARASREESLEWRRNIARYLTSRQGALRRVFLLVDIRVGLKKSDHDFMRSLEEDGRIPYQLVLTKADKLSRSRIQRQLETVLADAQVESERRGKRMGLHPRVVITSATRDLGLDEMRAHVSEACSVS
jgi:GTP-binding protein